MSIRKVYILKDSVTGKYYDPEYLLGFYSFDSPGRTILFYSDLFWAKDARERIIRYYKGEIVTLPIEIEKKSKWAEHDEEWVGPVSSDKRDLAEATKRRELKDFGIEIMEIEISDDTIRKVE